jgi:hypothetical protein
VATGKVGRGNSSQFYVAGELCRRGHYAVVTLGNTPNTDILCSNEDGTKFVHIQVKTFVPGNRTASIGKKAERSFGDNFFWVIAGIPKLNQDADFEYYIIPSRIMAEKTIAGHNLWLKTPGTKGQAHKDSSVRVVFIPPSSSQYAWDISPYKNAWHLIDQRLGP